MSNVEMTKEVIGKLRGLADSLETLIKSVNDHNEARGKSISKETINEGNTKDSAKESDNTTPKPASDTSKTPESQKEEKQPTLEEVRALLADKNRDGHREKIKALLQKYGANKLTSLDPTHYIKVMQEAGDIK